ncbi:hypothetical protein QQ008_08895 [Fulvivirgaceae bacterium BMA10]|uniref:Uncharacterized protein n=1 Tax=Splendidivirga corallicola TaxID=3051826 RepID=A0ABT8KL83_9BACT|nr:hypothetical protein [Fulvivirgaceae bacterium BMA10]
MEIPWIIYGKNVQAKGELDIDIITYVPYHRTFTRVGNSDFRRGRIVRRVLIDEFNSHPTG